MRLRIMIVALSLLTVVTLSSGCGKSTPTVSVAPTEEPAAATTHAPVETATSTATPQKGALEDPNALPPEPQPVTITAADGSPLQGCYYPSAKNPAPLVVLMHWAGGDKNDWNEIAVWLQNRGQVNPFANPGDMPWWNPTWFPAVPIEKSYAVLVFTFRGCLPANDGCQSMESAGWLQNAQAAMLKATELEGIDLSRIAAIGSSIGADGAPDGCLFLNEQYPGSCQGSLSLSPGNYLGVSYTATVKGMGQTEPPTAAWCLADEAEFAICEAAEGANNADYQDFMIPGGGHGNLLLQPDLDPLPMQLILDFLDESLN